MPDAPCTTLSTRVQRLDACRLGFVTRRFSLPELARRFGIPVSTLKKRSMREGWGVARAEVQARAEEEFVPRVATELADLRIAHARSAVERAMLIQQCIGQALADANLRRKGLSAKALLHLVNAEYKADAIVWRNLGMVAQGNDAH